MHPKKVIQGKKILVVDDDKDILDTLTELLQMCTMDLASNFEQAKLFLAKNVYDVAILDIVGVNGFELLRIVKDLRIPALMLTANALSEENLKRAVDEGAWYYVSKDDINRIEHLLADVIQAKQENRNPWVKWHERSYSGY